MQKTQRRSGLAISLRELAESGSLVDTSVANKEHEHADVEITQVGGVHDSRVFELPSGLTGCLLDLAIINQTSRTIYCFDIDLRLPWEHSSLNWLSDPIEEGKTECYRFPGRGGLEYPRGLVINHVLLENGRLTPKCPVQGLLLAIGGPVPESLRHGEWVDATLALTASDHEEYTSTVCLWTDRLMFKPKHAERKYNLYDGKIERDMGSMVATRDELRTGDPEIVKPRPTSARRTV